jgi:hypothetical protein
MRKSEAEEKYKELLKLYDGGIPLILEDFNLLNSYKKHELMAFLILYKRKCIELEGKLKKLVEE